MNKNDWQWLDMKRDMRRHVGDTAQRHYQKFTNDVSKRKDFKKPGSYVDHISSELDAVTKDNPWKNESRYMNRINEIGDTPRGQKALGAVFARAHNRKNWCDKNMVEPHRKYAKDYWQNVEHNASSEVGRNAKDKLKGFENFGDGAQEYYKNHLPNDTIQIPQHESKNGNMNKKLIRLTESDLHNIVKESVNRILKEANDHLLSIGGVEDTPFTRNNNKGSNGFRINGAFSGTYDYGMNPASVAMEMMKDKQPFDEFIDYCKQRGINPYDYIDTNDIEVQQWIEDYV